MQQGHASLAAICIDARQIHAHLQCIVAATQHPQVSLPAPDRTAARQRSGVSPDTRARKRAPRAAGPTSPRREASLFNLPRWFTAGAFLCAGIGSIGIQVAVKITLFKCDIYSQLSAKSLLRSPLQRSDHFFSGIFRSAGVRAAAGSPSCRDLQLETARAPRDIPRLWISRGIRLLVKASFAHRSKSYDETALQPFDLPD